MTKHYGPDRISLGNCLDRLHSCPALLHCISKDGCCDGCLCLHGNVFNPGMCVPSSQCGCGIHDLNFKVNMQGKHRQSHDTLFIQVNSG